LSFFGSNVRTVVVLERQAGEGFATAHTFIIRWILEVKVNAFDIQSVFIHPPRFEQQKFGTAGIEGVKMYRLLR